ncbi:Hypothetical protein PHPALM_9009 [Phytophthora palmivora]|uniref:Uncharacterized protein n=1 Tax=Phytophthora palmivora TaxID=4796 RepID=A0A2P4Y8E4_9STRA|nr:Hypothetical protein PHPALM_9009 [Phytophthora palmivora]
MFPDAEQAPIGEQTPPRTTSTDCPLDVNHVSATEDPRSFVTFESDEGNDDEDDEKIHLKTVYLAMMFIYLVLLSCILMAI